MLARVAAPAVTGAPAVFIAKAADARSSRHFVEFSKVLRLLLLRQQHRACSGFWVRLHIFVAYRTPLPQCDHDA